MKLKKEIHSTICFADLISSEITGYYLDYRDKETQIIRMQCYSISDEQEIGYEYYRDYYDTNLTRAFHI